MGTTIGASRTTPRTGQIFDAGVNYFTRVVDGFSSYLRFFPINVEQVAELIARAYRLDKIILTVFKANANALNFYKNKLKYAVDETDPNDEVWNFNHICVVRFFNLKMCFSIAMHVLHMSSSWCLFYRDKFCF